MNDKLVMGVGPRPCNGMIVGEAPGAEEEKQGKPFVGSSGELLDEALAVAGIERDRIYITNAYKLRPPGNRNPKTKELAEHSMILHREIGTVQPKWILTLGIIATEAFLYMGKGIGHMRGVAYKSGDYYVLPTFHPAYILRNSTEKEVWFGDIGRFVEEAFGVGVER